VLVSQDFEATDYQLHFEGRLDFFDLLKSLLENPKFIFEVHHLVGVVDQTSEDVLELDHKSLFVDRLGKHFYQNSSEEVVVVVKLESQVEFVLEVFPYLSAIL
jgi:hypothetical protein